MHLVYTMQSIAAEQRHGQHHGTEDRRRTEAAAAHAGQQSTGTRWKKRHGSILRSALGGEAVPEKDLGTAIHELFKPFGGVELEIPPREPMRELPRFD